MSRCTFGENFAVSCNNNGSFREKNIAARLKDKIFLFLTIYRIDMRVRSIDKIDDEMIDSANNNYMRVEIKIF